jgi:hypothetical protein
VPQEVRLSPPEFVDEFVACLRGIGTPARRMGPAVVVEDDVTEPEIERRVELLFFLRSWALSHPGLAFEVVDNSSRAR